MATQTKKKFTRHMALTIALKFILKKDLTNKRSLRDGYGLCPSTINKIERGEAVRNHAYEKYFETFFGIINDYRCRIDDNDEKHQAAKALLFDMFLLNMGREREAERRKREFMKEFVVH